jgi:tetratricopeptide (TPR) repeat protein
MKLFVLIGLALAGTCYARNVDPALIHARDAQDRGALQNLVSAARSAAEKAPKDAETQYRLALALSTQAEVALELKDKSSAEKSATEGVKAAESAIALRGDDGEYYRVLGTLCGQVIPANPIMGALGYGKRAKDSIEKAKQLSPKSAEVWIADGVGNYYLPPSFGGGYDIAIRSFKRALELEPNNAEAWLWLGLAQHRNKQDAEARISFAKSLALDPNRLWAKLQLDKIAPK